MDHVFGGSRIHIMNGRILYWINSIRLSDVKATLWGNVLSWASAEMYFNMMFSIQLPYFILKLMVGLHFKSTDCLSHCWKLWIPQNLINCWWLDIYICTLKVSILCLLKYQLQLSSDYILMYVLIHHRFSNTTWSDSLSLSFRVKLMLNKCIWFSAAVKYNLEKPITP